MKQIKKALIIVVCFAMPSTNAKQVGNKATSNDKTSLSKASEGKQTQVPQQEQTIFDTMPTYEQIFSLLKNKKPETSNSLVLKNIQEETQYQISLIQNKKHDMRAKKFEIKQASDMKTYDNILTALRQREPNDTNLSVLIKIQSAAKEQMEQLNKQDNIAIYSDILSSLQKSTPTPAVHEILDKILIEAMSQRDDLDRKG